jgi:hypothetical protein
MQARALDLGALFWVRKNPFSFILFTADVIFTERANSTATQGRSVKTPLPRPSDPRGDRRFRPASEKARLPGKPSRPPMCQTVSGAKPPPPSAGGEAVSDRTLVVSASGRIEVAVVELVAGTRTRCSTASAASAGGDRATDSARPPKSVRTFRSRRRVAPSCRRGLGAREARAHTAATRVVELSAL